ncbi:MAG: putative LPS assembly protein LptD, partial [Chitinophagaceae bacterium]
MLQVTKSTAQNKPSSKSLTKPLEKKEPQQAIANDSSKTDTNSVQMQLLGDTSLKKISTKTINTIDTLQISKDSLDAPVKYSAKDSGVLFISTKDFFLYGKSNVEQKTMTLDAGVIRYNGGDQTLFAFGATDSSNNPLNKVKMQDGQNTTYSDTLSFNLKNQKGRTVNSYYTEGELFVNAQVLKKIDTESFYGYKGRFTTCNLDTPHFAFRTRKLKMISNKLAISGPASPEFEGVPIPIGIPFGIYPLSRGRHSGVLAPQFTTSEDFGIGLEGLGYYKVLSDNFDVTVRSNIYSYGGWSLNVAPKYIVRYKYNGSMNITFQNTKSLNRFTSSQEEFTSTQTFNVTWNHTRDNRARPGTSFGATVNFGSTRFNSSVLNNPNINFNNRLNSNINYTKDFRGKANLSLNASHDQNATDRSVRVQLPTIGLNVVTFYPFQKKEKVGKAKWYESLGVGYGGSFTNSIAFFDSAINLKNILDTIQWGATHNIPIALSLPALGPITISPSVSYNEVWYDRTYGRVWNDATKKIDSSITKGLVRKPNTSFGLSLSTRVFGTYLFKHSKNIKAIRHEIRPSIGFNYTPNLESKYVYSLQVDSNKNTVDISKVTGQIVGNTSSFGNISFGVDNLFEMKVKDKSDTAAKAFKKVRLIDVLSISSSYNLAVDSFALQPFSIRLATNLFEKFNISASTTLDPYNVDERGYRKKTLMWQNDKFSIGRITSGNLAISTQLKSKPKDDKKAKDNKLPNDPFMTPDEQQRQLEYARSNPAEFTDFNIPWSVNLSYSLNFTRQPKADYSGFETRSNSSLSFNGDFNLSPKWKMGGTGYYDFSTSKLQQLSLFISREMHCWQMSINVTPVNILRSFSITISPKSGILRDLKINRTRQFSN